MASPLVVVLVVALGGGGDETTQTLARSVQEALGEQAVVHLREERTLGDEHLRDLGSDLRADALVVVSWPGESREEARLHAYATPRGPWRDRTVVFDPADPPAERGRALGYGIATMVSVGAGRPPAPAEPGAPAAGPPPRPTPAPDADFRRWLLDARGQGAVALGDEGSGLGAAAALGHRLAHAFAVHVGGRLRVGDVEPASAEATYLGIGGGASWTTLMTAGARPLTLGVRVDVLALRSSLRRSDGPSTGARWMPAGALVVEPTWAVTSRTAVVAGVGVEVAAGSTRVLVDDRKAATLTPARALFELGLRVGLD